MRTATDLGTHIHQWLEDHVLGAPQEPATPHGVTAAPDLTLPTRPETFECAGCDDEHTTVPVLEPAEVYMVGTDRARRYCTQQCADNDAERHWTGR